MTVIPEIFNRDPHRFLLGTFRSTMPALAVAKTYKQKYGHLPPADAPRPMETVSWVFVISDLLCDAISLKYLHS